MYLVAINYPLHLRKNTSISYAQFTLKNTTNTVKTQWPLTTRNIYILHSHHFRTRKETIT